MFPVSSLFKQYITNFDRVFEIQAVIAGVTYSSGAVIDFDIEDTIVPGEELSIGSVITSRLTLSLKTTDVVPTNAKITPSVRLSGDGGFTEWMPLSDFFIDERSFQNNVWKFTCYDRLLITNQDYVSSLIFPVSMQTAWDEICAQLGLASDSSVAINPAYEIPYEPLDFSMRDVMGFIASAHGASVAIAKNGMAKFVKIVGGATTDISASDYIAADKTNSPKTVTKIILTFNEDGETLTVGAGTDDQTLRITNPFMDEPMLDTLFAEINGFTYTPFTMNWKGRPDLETGDHILITMRDGSTIPSVILTNKMSFKGGLLATSTAPSISENRSETDYKVNLKSFIVNNAVMQDKPYYGVSISRKFGIKITKSDGTSRAIFNSDFLKFTGENSEFMLNQWGFNPDFIKRFPNKVFNSSFEWYDLDTLSAAYWEGTGKVTELSNWAGTVSMSLESGQFIEQGMFNSNTHAGANPVWWNDTQTRVSLKYKGGAIRVSVLKVIDSAAYSITDNSDTSDEPVIRTGLTLDYPAVANWEDGYISFYFIPVVGAGKVKIRIENVDASNTAYVDAVQIEPDFTGMWPSLYTDGPRSIPMTDVLGMPGAGGIYNGLDADKPDLVSGVSFSFTAYAQGLGCRISDSTLWGVINSAYTLRKYNMSGAQIDFWQLFGGSNGAEIDGDNDDFLWVTTRLDRVEKYRLSTKTDVPEVEYSNMATVDGVIRSCNGICAPPGEFLYYGIAGSSPAVRKMRKSDGAIIAHYNLTNEPSDLAWDGTNVWVSYAESPEIECYDPADFSLISTFDGPYANHQGLTWDGQNLWVSYPAGNGGNGIISKLGNATAKPAVLYYATDTKKIYWNVNGTWVEAGTTGGTNSFLGLTDSPDTYTGQAGKVLAVNAAEDGIEFVTGGGSGGAGVSSIAKSGSSKLVGDVVLEAGANVTLTQDDAAKKITIAATGGGGGGVSKQWFRTYAPDVAGLSTSAFASKGFQLFPDHDIVIHGISLLCDESTNPSLRLALYEMNAATFTQIGGPIAESGIIVGKPSLTCVYKFPVPITLLAGKTYVVALRNVTAGATVIRTFTSAGVTQDSLWGGPIGYARITNANPQAGAVWEMVQGNAPMHGGVLLEI